MTQFNQFTLVDANPDLPRHDGASIIELKDGRLLLAWMEHTGGKEIGHDHAPASIASMVSSDEGLTWTDRNILVENNPSDSNIHFSCFARLNNGEILFYYQRRHFLAPGAPQRSTSFVCRSTDEGQSFSAERKPDVVQESTMSANLLVQLSTGRIILPATEISGDWCGVNEDGQSANHCVSGFCYSDDNGDFWKVCSTWADLPQRGAMEPHVVELKDGRLLHVLKDTAGCGIPVKLARRR